MTDYCDGPIDAKLSITNGKSEDTQAVPTRPANVVPLPDGVGLDQHHRLQLHASGLSDETIQLASLYTERIPARLADKLGWSRAQRSRCPALMFPYFATFGESNASTDAADPLIAGPQFVRAKPDRPRTRKSRDSVVPIKYEQPLGQPVLPYLPPRTRLENRLHNAQVVIFTEGEKKSLLLDQLGFAVVGAPGVWNFHDVAHKRATGQWRLHPLYARHLVPSYQRLVILFDADCLTNDDVMNAARRLAGMARDMGYLDIRIAIIPHDPNNPKMGIDDYYVQILNQSGPQLAFQAVQEIIDNAQLIQGTEPTQELTPIIQHKSLEDAPVSPDILMPPEYSLGPDGGMWRRSNDGKDDAFVGPGVLLVRRIMIDLYDKSEKVQVAFKRNGLWKSAIVDRFAIRESRKLVSELAPHGAPVDSGCASEIVRWFSRMESINEQSIPRTVCVSRCGWHNVANQWVFCAPQQLLEDSGQRPLLVFDPGHGLGKATSGLGTRGDREQHLQALRAAWDADPIASIAIAASLASCLLQPLGAPGFGVHLVGDSSRGKSSILKVAASIWGDPQSTDWVASWNMTTVGAELRAATLCDLPFCADESGMMAKKHLESLIYMLINGSGRSRGNRSGGLQDTRQWRTIVLSTGEHELAEEISNTGAQARILHLHVSGFGDLDAHGVDAIRDACCQNYGTVGREWALWWASQSDQWDYHRDQCHRLVGHVRDLVPAGSVYSRQANYWALLMYAEIMAHELMGIGGAYGGRITQAIGQMATSTPVIESASQRALEALTGELVANRHRIAVLEPSPSGPTTHYDGHQELIAYRDPADGSHYLTLKFVREVFDRNNLSWSALRDMRSQGSIRCNEPRRTTYRLGVDGQRIRLVCLVPVSDLPIPQSDTDG